MRTIRILLLSFVVLVLIATGFAFFAPSLAMPVLVRLEAPRALVMHAPNRCNVLTTWLERTSTHEQRQVWPQLSALARLEPVQFQNQLANPGPMGLLAGLMNNAKSNPDLAQNCLKKALASIQAFPSEALALFKQKTLAPEWVTPVLGACRGNEACVELAMKELDAEAKVPLRQSWMQLLAELGRSSANVALKRLQALPKLGFNDDDTHVSIRSEANLLTEIFVKSQLRDSAQLLNFVLDNDNSLPLRWRIALEWTKLEGPRQELWPLAEHIMNDQALPESSRREALIRFGPLWNSHQQLVSELARQLRDLAERLPSSNDPARAVRDQITVIEAFRSSSRDPQSVPTPLNDKASTELSQAVAKLVVELRRKIGPKSEVLTELMAMLRQNQLFSNPSEVIKALMQNPQTADLGMLLLTGDGPLSPSKVISLRESFDILPRERRADLILEIKEPTLAAALLPAIPAESARRLWKSPMAGSLPEQLQLWSSQEDFPIALRTGFFAASSRNNQDASLKTTREHFRKDFACDSLWIRTAQQITEHGLEHPAFAIATLALMKCPAEQIDSKLISRELLGRSAQKKIQAEIDLGATAPAQLKRLSEFYALSNKVPGSALPAKIKRNDP